MSEWKELKIDDLPSDILVGEYEFSYSEEYKPYEKDFPVYGVLAQCLGRSINEDKQKFAAVVKCTRYYRKRQPEKKRPTHEEELEEIIKQMIAEFDKLCDSIRSLINTKKQEPS